MAHRMRRIQSVFAGRSSRKHTGVPSGIASSVEINAPSRLMLTSDVLVLRMSPPVRNSKLAWLSTAIHRGEILRSLGMAIQKHPSWLLGRCLRATHT